MPNTAKANTSNSDGRGELRPSLIASTHTVNPIFDPEHGSLYSIDMMRLRIRTRPEQFEAVQMALDTWAGADEVSTYTSNRVGSYRFLWTYYFEESSVTVGYAHINGSGKTDAGSGFLEYNPNKVGERGAALMRYLQGRGAVLEPLRYDLAIDYPIARDMVRMVKDSRKYGCEISDSMTEYLGQRNKPGRVKVYDKTAEAGLPMPCTRVELTADAAWSAEQIAAQLPSVYSYDSPDLGGLQRMTKAFSTAVMALVERGDVAETWLRMVDPKTKTKLHKAMTAGAVVEYSPECIAKMVERVSQWGQGTAENRSL